LTLYLIGHELVGDWWSVFFSEIFEVCNSRMRANDQNLTDALQAVADFIEKFGLGMFIVVLMLAMMFVCTHGVYLNVLGIELHNTRCGVVNPEHRMMAAGHGWVLLPGVGKGLIVRVRARFALRRLKGRQAWANHDGTCLKIRADLF
jgi:hypothetical protein